MSFSDYAEGKVLDHVFSLAAAYPRPTLYLGVSTTDPTDAGSSATEPAGGAYARIATTASDWQRTGSVVDNTSQLSFPEATASWGTLTHFVMYDAATGGNVIAHTELTSAKAIASNETLRFPVGNITFTLD